jgi:hypothetical protein
LGWVASSLSLPRVVSRCGNGQLLVNWLTVQVRTGTKRLAKGRALAGLVFQPLSPLSQRQQRSSRSQDDHGKKRVGLQLKRADTTQ